MIMEKYDDLTANFKYYEWWSGDVKTGKNSVEPPDKYFDSILTMATELQKVRDALNRDKWKYNRRLKEVRIQVASGYRTPEWNRSRHVRGAKDSLHVKGLATDSRAIGIPLLVYHTYVSEYTILKHRGYYRWKNFIHTGITNDLILFKW